jgi:hypothetical protein
MKDIHTRINVHTSEGRSRIRNKLEDSVSEKEKKREKKSLTEVTVDSRKPLTASRELTDLGLEEGLTVNVAGEAKKTAGSSPSESSINSLDIRGRLPCKMNEILEG